MPPPEVPLQALAVALPAFEAMAPEELPPGFGSGGSGSGPQLVSAFGVEGGVGWVVYVKLCNFRFMAEGVIG